MTINKASKCVNAEELSICAPEPWIELATRVASRLRKPANLASKVSLYRRLVLKLLGIRVYRVEDGTLLWAIVNGGGESVNVELTELDWFTVYSKKLPKVIALALAEPLRVIIFTTIGASGVLVNLMSSVFVYTLVHDAGVIAYPIASTVGFETSVVWNFTLHECVTFRGRVIEKTSKGVATRLLKYHFASLLSYVSQVSIATILPVLLGVHFWFAQFLGIIVGFMANFIFGYAYTWSMHLLRGDAHGSKAQEVHLR